MIPTQNNILEPLVSIIVITYNNSKYVLETLESTKAQTYLNIELIVSDDCSKDDTIAKCRNWIKKNEDRFVRVELLTVKENTGIAANCNRGLKATEGEWIKIIAGDDTLTLTSIESFLTFINNRNDEKISFIHSSMNYYYNEIKESSFKGTLDKSKHIFNHPNCKANLQYEWLLRDIHIGAPSTFFKKATLLEVGGFDEEMPFEDWPIYIKFTAKGYRLFYLKKETVNYRLHNSSFYNNEFMEKYIYNPFFENERVVFNKYIKNHLPIIERAIYIFEFERKALFARLGFNNRKWINKFINYPFLIFNILYKRYTLHLLKHRITKEVT